MDYSNTFNQLKPKEKALKFDSVGSIYDLMSEMQSNGLSVNTIDTSGKLTRCQVSDSLGGRSDKGNEKSGWYIYHQLDEHFVCVYGNWRTGAEFKYTSYEKIDTLSDLERRAIYDKLEDAKKRGEIAKHEKYENVAISVETEFKEAEDVTWHKYLDDKQVKIVNGLKLKGDTLLIPIYSIIKGSDNGLSRRKIIRSLQYIKPDGTKRFKSGGEVSGNFFPIGFDVTDLDTLNKLVICEGLATGISIHQACGLPVAVVFSANFGLNAVTKLRSFTQAQFLICFDNDESNVGEEKAREIVSATPNALSRLPSNKGDFNDIAQSQGLEQVAKEIHNRALGVLSHSAKNFKDSPQPRAWLVDRFIEHGKPGILAAVGGIGKSFLMLDLCLKISNGEGDWLGKAVKRHGNTCMLASEDDTQEINRRIHLLDPYKKRMDSKYDSYIVPVPDLGQPITLIREDREGLRITEQGHELLEELKNIPNLELVVLDPIQSFVAAPITTSQESAQLWGQFMTMISAQTGATTVAVHHMNKTALLGGSDSITARAQIRGSSSLLDSVRFAISLFLSSEEEAEKICFENGVDLDRFRVIKAGIVKTNSGEVDTSLITLFRKDAILEVYDGQKSILWD